MSSSFQTDSGGFTLIEVMISLLILTFISLGIYNAMTTAYRLRDDLSVEGEFYNRIRLAVGLLERDLEQTYSPMAMLPQPSPTPGAPGQVPGAPPPPPVGIAPADLGDLERDTLFWNGTTNAAGVRASHFVGTENKLTFISVSHFRMYKDAHECEFAKITYELKPDPDAKDHPEMGDLQVLTKTEDTDAFDLEEGKVPAMSHSYPLLGGIKKLAFQYYRKDKDQWVSSWDNQKDDFKNLYPDIVKLTVQVEGAQHLEYDGRYEFNPEVPLNGPLATTY